MLETKEVNAQYIQIFSDVRFGSIRIMQSKTGDPLFVARDIATSLGYSVPQKAVLTHCKHCSKLEHPFNKGTMLNFIPESDVYRLIMRSKMSRAEAFQDWVVEEVLPSIRKTGSYAVPTPQPHPVLQVPKVKYRYRTRIVPAAMNPQDRKDLEVVRKFREGQGNNLYRVAQTMLDNHTAYMDLIGGGVDYRDLKRRFHHTHDLVKFLMELEERA